MSAMHPGMAYRDEAGGERTFSMGHAAAWGMPDVATASACRAVEAAWSRGNRGETPQEYPEAYMLRAWGDGMRGYAARHPRQGYLMQGSTCMMGFLTLAGAGEAAASLNNAASMGWISEGGWEAIPETPLEPGTYGEMLAGTGHRQIPQIMRDQAAHVGPHAPEGWPPEGSSVPIAWVLGLYDPQCQCSLPEGGQCASPASQAE